MTLGRARSRTAVTSFSTARWRARISASLAPSVSSCGELGLERGEAALGVEVACPLDLGDLRGELGLEVRQVGVALSSSTWVTR